MATANSGILILAMIIKQSDPLKTRKLELEILKQYDLPSTKSYLVDQEWKRLVRGEKGEKNTAYHLDFYLTKTKNWMLIHDLRIEHNGQTAQIDHLLITRVMEVFVLETKAFGDTLKMLEDGSFIASYGTKEHGIPSPVEQNKRHIHLLKQVIKDLNLSPKRLGISLPIEFMGYVLVDTETRLIRPEKLNSQEVIKSDQFVTFLDKELEKIGIFDIFKKLGKAVSQKTVEKFAESLASLHTKSNVNYKERFEITDADLARKKSVSVHEPGPAKYNISNANTSSNGSQNYCAQCKTTIPAYVAKFCFDRKERFKGRAYCMSCQNNY